MAAANGGAYNYGRFNWCIAGVGGEPRGPAGEEHDEHRADADEDAARDVDRVVHPAVHPRERDERRHEDRKHPKERAVRAARQARGEQQHEAGVDRHRRGGVAGRVARVDRQALEAVHVRAVAVDEDRRDAVDRRLCGERDERVGGEAQRMPGIGGLEPAHVHPAVRRDRKEVSHAVAVFAQHQAARPLRIHSREQHRGHPRLP